MGDQFTPLTAREARHLLRRTGFGADPREVQRLTGVPRGVAADQILGFRPSRFRPGGRDIDQAQGSWIKYMLGTKAPLQEKLVLFWHDHFATSDQTVRNAELMRNQNRTFRQHCKGNFRTLVRQINLDPAMMQFLDTVRNRKEQPNENYARELLELFTLGVFDLNGNANYAQQDIVQIARAFTGWDYDRNSLAPVFRSSRHDYAASYPERGPKVIFTTVGGFGPAGRAFDANGEGAAEIDTVIDIIFDHRDSSGRNTVARHIARKLITYFAHPEPATAFVDAVIAASAFDSTFELQPLLRSIFVHDDFYLSAAPPGPGTKKSFKWPVDYVIGTMRQLRLKPKGRDVSLAGGSYSPLRWHIGDMGQTLFEPPSVFGWDWEEAWASSQTMLARYTFARDIGMARENGAVGLRATKLIDPTLTDPAQIVDAVTELLGVKDDLPAAARQGLIDYLGPGPIEWSDSAPGGWDTRNRKIHGLFSLVLQSPYYQLH